MKISSIHYESGLSFEIKGNWYKVSYAEERTIEKGDNAEEEIKKLTEHCDKVIDDKVEEIREAYK